MYLFHDWLMEFKTLKNFGLFILNWCQSHTCSFQQMVLETMLRCHFKQSVINFTLYFPFSDSSKLRDWNKLWILNNNDERKIGYKACRYVCDEDHPNKWSKKIHVYYAYLCVCPGVPPIVYYTRRLCPKEVPLSGWR